MTKRREAGSLEDMNDDMFPPVVVGHHVRVGHRRLGDHDVFETYRHARERLAAVARERGAQLVAVGIAALTPEAVELTGRLV